MNTVSSVADILIRSLRTHGEPAGRVAVDQLERLVGTKPVRARYLASLQTQLECHSHLLTEADAGGYVLIRASSFENRDFLVFPDRPAEIDGEPE